MKTITDNSTIDLQISDNFNERYFKYVPAVFITGKRIKCEFSVLPPDYGFSDEEIEESKRTAQTNAALIVKAVNNHLLLLRKLESLVYVLEMERKQNGISLSDDYKTLYKEAKQLLEQLK